MGKTSPISSSRAGRDRRTGHVSSCSALGVCKEPGPDDGPRAEDSSAVDEERRIATHDSCD